ncbi:tyrosine-protein phosphatase [Propionibacterium freudenreichii]|uniref:tyrosine-protein phosphatase n=1 Tax=Propionibacterium freudenreichii TaxID=1744 RepID=UPI00385396B7
MTANPASQPTPGQSTPSQPAPGAHIELESLPNLRDIGGYPIAGGGRVRTGVLYRSAALSRLSPADADALQRRDIRTIFDFRTEVERTAQPDVVPDGMHVVLADVLADAASAAPDEMLEAIKDPLRASQLLAGDQTAAIFDETYRQIVSSDSALAAYRSFFTDIADPANRPALFHCTSGKDRTGWAAAALLLLLGVDEADVFHDYELTNQYLPRSAAAMIKKFTDGGGDPSTLTPVLGVDPKYLRAALTEMTSRFGSITGYFRDGLGMDDDAQDTLRAALTA